MRNLINVLSGKKTYIVAIVIAVLNFAVAMNWVTVDQLTSVNYILVALGFSAVRAGISKVE
jgi:hypothetical protein